MPAAPPPNDLAGTPHVVVLDAGATVWRVHGRYPPCAVNPTPRPAIPGGGRFDSLTGDYAYTYVGDSPDAAIAETLCRDLPVTGSPRLVPRVRITGTHLTRLTVTTPVPVIALHGPHLAAIGQDTWLTASPPSDYVTTREWARALLVAADTAAGLVYRCRHDNDRFAWMLTAAPERETHPALAAADEHVALDSPAGIALVDTILACYNAALATAT
ncbi:RES family NAD+ phosphorylase [Tomitella gaofuii]|uniref:RES family NAD+ phosphorylase n=1 Tax=Tomitella gaofuii TaxID=2760083 RepID=UPI0015F94E81|nr:RES family NAD+ phosphorylase [Tomitella gaofuii]